MVEYHSIIILNIKSITLAFNKLMQASRYQRSTISAPKSAAIEDR